MAAKRPLEIVASVKRYAETIPVVKAGNHRGVKTMSGNRCKSKGALGKHCGISKIAPGIHQVRKKAIGKYQGS